MVSDQGGLWSSGLLWPSLLSHHFSVSVGPVYSGIFFRAETLGQVTQVIHQFPLYIWCWPVIVICVAAFSWVPVELTILRKPSVIHFGTVAVRKLSSEL